MVGLAASLIAGESRGLSPLLQQEVSEARVAGAVVAADDLAEGLGLNQAL